MRFNISVYGELGALSVYSYSTIDRSPAVGLGSGFVYPKQDVEGLGVFHVI